MMSDENPHEHHSWLPETLVVLGGVGILVVIMGIFLAVTALQQGWNPNGATARHVTATPAMPVTSGGTPVGGPHGKIAFTSGYGSTGGIYVIEPDGSHLTRLVGAPGVFMSPAWSPDGTHLAYVNIVPTGELWVISANGSGAHNLTNSPAYDGSPAWSPGPGSAGDGMQLVFQSDHTGMSKLYLAAADGSGLSVVTTGPDTDESPNWSPDGTQIVFASIDQSGGHLYLIYPDGTGKVALTNGVGAMDDSPVWSPDGRWIAFLSGGGSARDLCVIAPDGSGRRCLTSGVQVTGTPVWSPDSTRIACTVAGGSGYQSIELMSTAPGSGAPIRLVDGSSPSWSPDGTQIAFVSSRDGNDEIYVINVDKSGTGLLRLTNNPDADESPAWGK